MSTILKTEKLRVEFTSGELRQTTKVALDSLARIGVAVVHTDATGRVARGSAPTTADPYGRPEFATQPGMEYRLQPR